MNNSQTLTKSRPKKDSPYPPRDFIVEVINQFQADPNTRYYRVRATSPTGAVERVRDELKFKGPYQELKEEGDFWVYELDDTYIVTVIDVEELPVLK